MGACGPDLRATTPLLLVLATVAQTLQINVITMVESLHIHLLATITAAHHALLHMAVCGLDPPATTPALLVLVMVARTLPINAIHLAHTILPLLTIPHTTLPLLTIPPTTLQ